MALRPVFLTELVRVNPPSQAHATMCTDPMKRALAFRNATLGCALYLSEAHEYILMQDRVGGIWVQHKRSPIIMTPPGGLIFRVKGDPLPYQRWLCFMHKLVRQEGRVALDPNLSFRRGVQQLYSDHYKDDKPSKLPLDITPRRSVLKALNPYIAHRTWISKFLGGLGFTQMLISSLTKGLWQRETRKALWSNIARLYTLARNQEEPGLVLGDFTRVELIRNNQDPSPRTFLLTCGVNIDEIRTQLVPNCDKIDDKVDAQTIAPDIPTPVEWVYPRVAVVSNVYFREPTGVETPEEKVLDYTPTPHTPHDHMNYVTGDILNSYAEFIPKGYLA